MRREGGGQIYEHGLYTLNSGELDPETELHTPGPIQLSVLLAVAHCRRGQSIKMGTAFVPWGHPSFLPQFCSISHDSGPLLLLLLFPGVNHTRTSSARLLTNKGLGEISPIFRFFAGVKCENIGDTHLNFEQARQTHKEGLGAPCNYKIDRVDQNSTRREEHGNIPVGASSFLLSCMSRFWII